MKYVRHFGCWFFVAVLAPAGWAAQADLNADGIVSFPDFAILASQWLTTGSGNVHVWHVSKTGNDSNDGHSFSTSLLTIGSAAGAAKAGDIILVWPGTYDESVILDKQLVLLGVNRYSSIIHPTTTAADALIVDANGCIVSGIHAKTERGNYSAIKVNRNDDVVIENCIADGNEYGIETYFNVVDYFQRMSIRGCAITGGYTGLYIGHAYHVSVERCQITTTGVNPKNGDIYGIRNRVGRDVIIRDCSVWVKRDYSNESGTLMTYGIESQGRASLKDVAVHVSTTNVPLSGIALDLGVSCGGGTLVFNDGFVTVGGYADEVIAAEVAAANNLLMSGVVLYLGGIPSTSYSLYNSPGGVLAVHGCIYDTTRTYGTITGGW